MTTTTKYKKRVRQLRDQLHENSWLSHWNDIAEYMLPRKGRYMFNDQDKSNDGKKKHSKIINGSAKDALRIIASGMQGGLTSPSRPWFKLGIADKDLMEYAPVREWLHNVRDAMLTVYSKSNFYGAVHGIYTELAAFGTAAMIQEEDFDTIVRFRPFTIGEYTLTLDSKYRPNGLYRQFSLTANQLVEKFGLDKVSDSVKQAHNDDQGESRFEVVHCVYPNEEGKDGEYASLYFESNADPEKILEKSTYRTKPFIAPRWDVTGVDVYGNSPGMDALGDIKMLQKIEADKLKAMAKMVDPPMNADTSLKGKANTIIPGGVNFVDHNSAGAGKGLFYPTYQVNPNLQNIAFEIDRVEQRVKRFFYNDLFLMLLGNDKTMTATEVAERHSEKLMMLGPVIERLESEFLDPMIDRTFNIMNNLGLLPPAPEQLQGTELNVDYIGLLAQAQKMVATRSIEQTAAFVANMATIKPEVIDKFDADEALDQYAEMVGTPPRIIVSDDRVAEIRKVREQQAQAAQMQAQASELANSAKVLSDTKMDQGSALDNVMQGII